MRRMKRWICLLVMGFVFCSILVPVSASSISEIQQEIRDQQQNLDQVNENISSLEDEQDILEEEINDLDAELLNMLTSIGILEDDIAVKEEEIVTAQAEYDAAVATEQEQYEAMKIRIQYMYENGDTSYLSILFEAESRCTNMTGRSWKNIRHLPFRWRRFV